MVSCNRVPASWRAAPTTASTAGWASGCRGCLPIARSGKCRSRTHSHVEVYLGRQIAAGGFGWLVPFRRGEASFARVGVMCDNRARSAFRSLSHRIAERFDVSPDWGEPRVRFFRSPRLPARGQRECSRSAMPPG